MKTQTDNKICGNCGQERNKHKGRYSDWDKIKGFPCQRFNPLVYDYKNSDYNKMEDDHPQKQEPELIVDKDILEEMGIKPKQDDIFPKEVYGYHSQEISEKQSKEPARVSPDNPQTIKFHTNTAWLLNVWFTDRKSQLYKEVRDWVEKHHDNHWKGINSSVVEVKFKILSKELK